jgi:sodium transport system ATP-binding protein
VIRVESLAKRFGDVRAVVDVSFVAENGRITGLLGPNGAGKTTTLRMISTLVAPSGGSARVDDCDVRAEPLAARARLGMLTDARGL